jgi:hypothetical protein
MNGTANCERMSANRDRKRFANRRKKYVRAFTESTSTPYDSVPKHLGDMDKCTEFRVTKEYLVTRSKVGTPVASRDDTIGRSKKT